MIRPLKDYDDVEARRAALSQSQERAEKIRMIEQAQRYDNEWDAPMYSPAPKPSSKLRRFPQQR